MEIIRSSHTHLVVALKAGQIYRPDADGRFQLYINPGQNLLPVHIVGGTLGVQKNTQSYIETGTEPYETSDGKTYLVADFTTAAEIGADKALTFGLYGPNFKPSADVEVTFIKI